MKRPEVITSSATISNNELVEGTNIDFYKGYIIRRKSWRTFEDMIEVLLDVNKRLKKLNKRVTYTVALPLNHSSVRKLVVKRIK